MSEVLFCSSIDVECDKDAHWRVRRPLSCSNVPEGVERVLKPLQEHFSVKWTLLISPEVLEDEWAIGALFMLEQAELGTHLHCEFVEPQAEHDCERTDKPQSALPAELEREKLERLTEKFEERTGKRPVSFRAGRFGYSSRTWEYLRTLEYGVDSSVTPWWKQRFEEGESHDHWGVRPEPYWLSPPEGPSDGGLLEVPPTIANCALLRVPDKLLGLARRNSWLKKGAQRIAGSSRPIWLRPVRSSAAEMMQLAEAVIDTWQGAGPPVLNMMFHSNELKAGMSPYCATAEDVSRLRKSVEAFLEKLTHRYSVSFLTLADVRQAWLRRALASSGLW